MVAEKIFYPGKFYELVEGAVGKGSECVGLGQLASVNRETHHLLSHYTFLFSHSVVFFFPSNNFFIYLFVIYCHYFYYVFSFILSGGWIRHTPIMLVKFSVAYVREAYSIGICINAFIFLYIYIHAHCVFHFCFSRFFFSSSFSSSSSPGPDRNRNRICAVNKVFSKKKKNW